MHARTCLQNYSAPVQVGAVASIAVPIQVLEISADSRRVDSSTKVRPRLDRNPRRRAVAVASRPTLELAS
jgi:hypothetical protein